MKIKSQVDTRNLIPGYSCFKVRRKGITTSWNTMKTNANPISVAGYSRPLVLATSIFITLLVAQKSKPERPGKR